MPFTPFHMGPSLVIKAIMQGAFSVLVFGWTQILMDIEPLIVLIQGGDRLHGISHTYMGATVIAIAAIITGKLLSELGLKIIRRVQYLPLSWSVTTVSAFLGAYSHILLDSLIHADMHPLYPFSQYQPLLHSVEHSLLRYICLLSGLVGAVLCFILEKRDLRNKS